MMGWKSIRWGVSDRRQSRRFERYADDSWAFFLPLLGRAFVAFVGQDASRRSPDSEAASL